MVNKQTFSFFICNSTSTLNHQNRIIAWILIANVALSPALLVGSERPVVKVTAEQCGITTRALAEEAIQEISAETKAWLIGWYLRAKTRKVLRGYTDDVEKYVAKMCPEATCTPEEIKTLVVMLLDAKHTEYLLSSPSLKAYTVFIASALLAGATSLTFKVLWGETYPLLTEQLKELNTLIWLPIVMAAGFPIIQRLQNATMKQALKHARIKRNAYEEEFEAIFWREKSMLSPNAIEARWTVNMALQHLKLNFQSAAFFAGQSGPGVNERFSFAAAPIAEAVEHMCTLNSDVEPHFDRIKRVAYVFFGKRYMSFENVDEFIDKVLTEVKYERGVTRDRAKRILEAWLKEPLIVDAELEKQRLDLMRAKQFDPIIDLSAAP